MKSEKLKTNGNPSAVSSGQSNCGASRLFNRLAREKKKTISAVCLIAVMVFMWVRVLARKTPQSAAADSVKRDEIRDTRYEIRGVGESKVSFIELPKIEGRNNVLTRDFFAVDSWQQFIKGGDDSSGVEGANIVSGDGLTQYVKQIAEKLKLETIVLGQNPEAFINDKLLGVGDKLLIRDGVGTYECEVIGIEENTVYMRCGKAKITLRLGQKVEAVD